ncbi:MAG: dihydropteroate synthase [Acidimicrobiales bacterium]
MSERFLQRPFVMGVLNITPDSFSDGGRYFDRDVALARGLEILAQGADVVDVGGESSRPGAEPVSEEEERRRVVPVIAELSRFLKGCPQRISIDTMKPSVAEAAVEAGASIINDISASLARTAASLGVGWVAMHMQGTPRDMQEDPRYSDVVTEVVSFLKEKASAALDIGVKEVWVDPGIGFGKRVEHNLALLYHLDELVAQGLPVLVGTSRKSFIGLLASAPGQAPPSVEHRLEGSLATAVWAMAQGAAMVRVHDVAATVQAATLVRPLAKSIW